MTAVPATKTVAFSSALKAVPPARALQIVVEGTEMMLMPGGDSAAFWYLRTSPDRDHCNMELTTQAVYAKAPRLASKHFGNCVINLPVATNFQAVEAGKEMVLFIEQSGDAEGQKKDATVQPIVAEKKRRVQ